MIPSRSKHAAAGLPAESAAPRAGLRQLWAHFWFSPVDPVGLHVLRVLAGLLFLCWLLPFAGHAADLFSPQGWFDARAYHEAARLPDGAPVPLGWSLLNLCGHSLALVRAVYALALVVFMLFTLGIATRVTSVLTWLAVVSFASSPAAGFEADWLLGILAFYLMVGYLLLGQWDGRPSLLGRLVGTRDTWLFGRRPAEGRPASYAANLAVRLLQVHFALVLVVSGLHKLQFGDWWAGVALWYPLHSPFRTTATDIRALAPHAQTYLVLLSLAAYGVLAWQIGFPLFAWRPRCRALLLGGAALGWLGASLVYRQPLFGPVLFIACLAYLTPAEWRGLLALPRRLVGRRDVASPAPALATAPARVGARA